MTYKNTVAIAATIVAATLAGQAAAKERLNFAYGYPNTSVIGKGVDDYAAAVSERSGGEVEVTGFAMS